MSQSRSPVVTDRMRLETLLDIGRTLSGTTDPAELRKGVLSPLSRLFGSDLLYVAETESAGTSRVLLIVEHGRARRADESYAPHTHAATPQHGVLLDAAATRAMGHVSDHAGPIAAALVVPIHAGELHLGEVGAVRFHGEAPFSDEDAELLGFAAEVLGAALGQRRRMDETEARRREAERLEEIGRAITASLDLERVLDRIMQAVLDLTNADTCSVWHRDGDRSRVLASRGTGAIPVGFEVGIVPQIESALITFQQSIQIEDIASDNRLPPDMRARFGGDGPRASILVPMVCDDTVVGVLSVGHHEPHRYDDEAMGILERLALHAAIALENARLHAEIRELSLTDPLTGLPNRRHLETVLATEVEAARRGRPLTVVLLDLDDFKKYNDEHGHTAGDAALREFAQVLAAETRAMNLAVRYGGDEFLVIMSESSEEGAENLIERVQTRLRANTRLRGIGVSAGIARHSDEMKTPAMLIEAADAAMYRSKNTLHTER